MVKSYFEYVCDWHGCIGKAVNKYCFQKTLGIVEYPCATSVALNEKNAKPKNFI